MLPSDLDTGRPGTLVEILEKRAFRTPDQLAFSFRSSGPDDPELLTYAGLLASARAISETLRKAVPAGSRALLLYAPGLEFVSAFFGCLDAGVVAVPALPPSPTRPDPMLPRLVGMATDCEPAIVLCQGALLGLRPQLCDRVEGLRGRPWLATDEIAPAGHPAVPSRSAPLESDRLALLQYTSGSTSRPSGVALTHGNLMANQRALTELTDLRSQGSDGEIIGVGWLPTHHDMGLIGQILMPVYWGFPAHLLSPLAFAKRPASWLRLISSERATISGGPNFAYELCLRRVGEREKQELDLSRWRVAFNGAEPIRAATLRRFAEAFRDCGFSEEAFFPCYGLAESTLIVTGGPFRDSRSVLSVDTAALEQGVAVAPSEPGAATTDLVSCGRSLPEQRVLIVDPEQAIELAEGRVGEIWTCGPSVSGGYWGNRTGRRSSFGHYLRDGRGPFLRTGDLGFTQDGRLFVTGRSADLILVQGRNIYPQDIECAVQRVDSRVLRSGSGAAFSLETPGQIGEAVVVVQEARSSSPEKLRDVTRAVLTEVSEQYGVALEGLILARSGSVPRTSSGKIQRSLCRERLRAGELGVLHAWWRRGVPLAGSANSAPAQQSPGVEGEP